MLRHVFFAPVVGSVLLLAALATRDVIADGWPWLAFNLGLAWVPLVLGAIASRHRMAFVLVGPVWLLFLPNAPYLLTDLVHLRARAPVPLWFDVALLGGAGALGLGMGVVSLRQVASAVDGWWGRWAARAAYVGVPILVGFGIYLGRFLRWNSWDLWFRPMAVLGSVAELVFDPRQHLHGWAVTATFAALFLAAALFAPPVRPEVNPG